MKKALLLVDFEEEWRTRGSEFCLQDFSRQVANAERLVAAFRQAGDAIVYTRHVEPGSTTAFAPGSRRVSILKELEPRSADHVFEKHKISPFFKTGLEAFLRRKKIQNLVVCGILTNLCVRSAVADAYDRDIGVTLVSDACASDSPATDRFTFADLRKTRPDVRVLRTEEVLRECGG